MNIRKILVLISENLQRFSYRFVSMKKSMSVPWELIHGMIFRFFYEICLLGRKRHKNLL